MKIKDISLIAMFCAVSVICSFFNIMLPLSPVVFSLSIFGVFLCGLMLNPQQAVLSQVLYILLGLAGLPVFSGFKGGAGVLMGPTGGYIIAYPVMAFIISFFCRKIKLPNILKLFVILCVSMAVCYLLGSLRLGAVMSISFLKALMMGAVPFVPFDIIKALAAAALSIRLKASLEKAGLL